MREKEHWVMLVIVINKSRIQTIILHIELIIIEEREDAILGDINTDYSIWKIHQSPIFIFSEFS